MASDQFLGGQPIVVPAAFALEVINVAQAGAEAPLGKVLDRIGDRPSVGLTDISDHAVNIEDGDRPRLSHNLSQEWLVQY